ncbi:MULTISPECIES: hypothetical protein [unclassified Janthinobacterium]|uniref:hypothetical protein n=1 Tax=unclassified Janthinobacterium TaxID=2610881 RepID=UPI00036346C0|nr:MULTISPECIES: hypothetical protein [unclassified Janthinobacterium]MEC5160585.1 membrane protease YdiL (CAAX protease family) [Janthinobacterium sp. CG_S6]
MRDSGLLMLAAALCSVIAWAFWHFLGNDAFGVFMIVALVIVAADNVRLRRKLREQRDK